MILPTMIQTLSKRRTLRQVLVVTITAALSFATAQNTSTMIQQPCDNQYTNDSNLRDRITQAIQLLETDEKANTIPTVAEITMPRPKTRTSTHQHEAVLILQSIQNDLILHLPPTSQLLPSQQQFRRLENGEQQANNYDNKNADADDYFNYNNGYSHNDVEISYDDEDNTVVMVGDDVIVVVEHEYTFYLYNGGMMALCIVIGATMAGLLMGVMSLDPLLISVKARTATSQEERQQAMTLLPFVQNKNLVLVSLLLVNCGTNEALPVFLDNMLENPLITVLLSLTVVLVVGEILPSAYFTGRNQLSSACKLVPLLRFVIVITSPISYPLAKLMDHYFHPSPEVSVMKRGEITAMVRIQYEEHLAWKRRHARDEIDQSKETMTTKGHDTDISPTNSTIKQCHTATVCNTCEPMSLLRKSDLYACVNPNQHANCTAGGICNIPSFTSTQQHQDIDDDDIVMLEGCFSLKDKKVKSAYTPMHRVRSIKADSILDEAMVVDIYSYGYSRIPAMQYLDDSKTSVGICGIVLTKQLMLIRKEDRRRVSSLTMYEPPCVSPHASLAEALNIILSGKRKSSNMALVCMDPEMATNAVKDIQPIPIAAGVLGIITLENILEELIQEPIYDEKDKKMNAKAERAKWVIGKWKSFVVQKRRKQKQDNTAGNNTVVPGTNHSFDYIELRELV